MTDIESRVSTVLAAKLAVPAKHGRLSRPLADDELRRRRDLVHRCIASHRGREFGGSGDEMHAEFRSTLDAVECSEAIITEMQESTGGGQGSGGGIGIGISLGDVRDDDQDLYGSAVDTANALRWLAGPNEIVVDGAVREQARQREDLAFRQLQTRPGQSLWASAYRMSGPNVRMSGSNVARSGHTFVQELVRRRVFRAMGAYVIVSWILVQVASIVFPEFDLTRDSGLYALIVLLTAGFPLAVLLAWTLDFSLQGFRRTPDSQYSRSKGNVLRFGVVGVATAMSAAVLWWVWADYVEPSTQRPERAAVKVNPVVAVHAPRKLAGPEDIDWLGDGVANLIRDELAESERVIVLSQSRWNEILSAATSPDDLTKAARKAGIDYVIAGQYHQTSRGIVLTSHIEDIENGRTWPGARLEEDDTAGVIAATAEITMSVKRTLRVPLKETVSRFAADFAVQNMDAYEAYVAGLRYFIDFDYQFAEESFAAALTIAPDFHMARFRLAEVLESTGRAERARDELHRIPDDAELTVRERLYIEGAKSSFVADRDLDRSIEIYQQLVAEYPYDLEGGMQLADKYWMNYQEDASIAKFQSLAELHGYDSSVWMALGERLLDVGELDKADVALQKYRAMAPTDHHAVTLLGNLAQLRGNYAASIEYYDEALRLKPGFAVATLGLARSHYLLGGEDNSRNAESLWSALIDDGSQAAGFRIDAAFDLAGVMRGQGRFTASMQPFASLEELILQEELRAATMRSTIGFTHLQLREPDLARDLFALAIAESPGVATRHLFARGLLELQQEQYGQLQNTAAEISALALPADDPDRTEDKAASYLLGLAALQQQDLDRANVELESAVTKSGYEYAIYALGLARLKMAMGEVDEAEIMARTAMTTRDPGDLRLDLELDRARASLLHAEILAQMGSVDDAKTESQRFLDRWHAAAEQSPELQRARDLLSSN